MMQDSCYHQESLHTKRQDRPVISYLKLDVNIKKHPESMLPISIIRTYFSHFDHDHFQNALDHSVLWGQEWRFIHSLTRKQPAQNMKEEDSRRQSLWLWQLPRYKLSGQAIVNLCLIATEKEQHAQVTLNKRRKIQQVKKFLRFTYILNTYKSISVLSMFVFVCMYALCVYSACRNQKDFSDPLELELLVFVSHHVDELNPGPL